MVDNAALTQTIAALRDVGGVLGSFVVARDGALVARDLGALFPDDLLAEVAPRVARIADAPAAEQGEPSACVIRFAEHMLFVRAFGAGALCVLAAAHVSLPALKMGTTLVARRVEPLTTRPPAPPPPPRVTPAPAPPTQPTIQYRGAVLADRNRR